MNGGGPRCTFCGEPLSRSGFFQKMEGWQRPGKGIHGKSGSSLVLRQPLQEFACSRCINAKKQGVDPNQMRFGG